MRKSLAAATVVACAVGVVPAGAQDNVIDTAPEANTLNGTLTGAVTAAAYSELTRGPGWERVVREARAPAGAGRASTRQSLTYFGQLTDFQLSDEESPARVEFADVDRTPATSAWRPQEALLPHIVDQGIRALNLFGTSGLSGAPLEMNLVTGDQADNQQRNEVEWVVRLLEGGTVKPNSGVDSPCAPEGEAKRYTGVQDHDDYAESNYFYDPDNPHGFWGDWPKYTGLMDAAQKPFRAAGSSVPTYVAFGNHDALVQGNAWATAVYESLATGCAKVFGPVPARELDGSALVTSPENTVNVPPDPNRQFVDRVQYRALHANGEDQHGFSFIDPAELDASAGAASYYDWSPKPGLHFVSIDTVSDGGVVGPSSDGNVDDPQFQWLRRTLEQIPDTELVVVFGHHPIRSLTADVPDEVAAPCTGSEDAHGHDHNPGCDKDPRSSAPVHLGEDVKQLFLSHPNVIGYVAGHTHEHRVTPFARTDGSGGFWGIETSALADWPLQSRLVEVFDNRDGTLSIFGTLIDHTGPINAPGGASPLNASRLSPAELASIGRTFAFNDPQAGDGTGVGGPADRNVELLVPDPRPSAPPG